jgi:large subunit ribosomal protein L18
MSTMSLFHERFLRRRNRTRAALATNQSIPRLSVFRSLRHISAQIIDDQTGRTLAATGDIALKATGNKTEVAQAVGKGIAELAVSKKITAVRFDRGAHRYHGRIAALAEAARESGLKF